MADLENPWSDVCPLCCDPWEDVNFFPCPCGFQVCMFCWHNIRENYNGLCPGCRREYSDQPQQRPEVAAAGKSAKARQQAKRERRLANERAAQAKAAGGRGGGSDQGHGTGGGGGGGDNGHGVGAAAYTGDDPMGRRRLAGIRVVQRNLVYVIGLPLHLAKEEILRRHEFFGQYGAIVKVVPNRSNLYNVHSSSGPSCSAYVTYQRNEDAVRCIESIDGVQYDGRTLRASRGTTKYCSHWLRYQPCNNSDCMYLHEVAPSEDSFTKEDMQAGKHNDVSSPSAPRKVSPGTVPLGGRGFPPHPDSVVGGSGGRKDKQQQQQRDADSKNKVLASRKSGGKPGTQAQGHPLQQQHHQQQQQQQSQGQHHQQQQRQQQQQQQQRQRSQQGRLWEPEPETYGPTLGWGPFSGGRTLANGLGSGMVAQAAPGAGAPGTAPSTSYTGFGAGLFSSSAASSSSSLFGSLADAAAAGDAARAAESGRSSMPAAPPRPGSPPSLAASMPPGLVGPSLRPPPGLASSRAPGQIGAEHAPASAPASAGVFGLSLLQQGDLASAAAAGRAAAAQPASGLYSQQPPHGRPSIGSAPGATDPWASSSMPFGGAFASPSSRQPPAVPMQHSASAPASASSSASSSPFPAGRSRFGFARDEQPAPPPAPPGLARSGGSGGGGSRVLQMLGGGDAAGAADTSSDMDSLTASGLPPSLALSMMAQQQQQSAQPHQQLHQLHRSAPGSGSHDVIASLQSMLPHVQIQYSAGAEGTTGGGGGGGGSGSGSNIGTASRMPAMPPGLTQQSGTPVLPPGLMLPYAATDSASLQTADAARRRRGDGGKADRDHGVVDHDEVDDANANGADDGDGDDDDGDGDGDGDGDINEDGAGRGGNGGDASHAATASTVSTRGDGTPMSRRELRAAKKKARKLVQQAAQEKVEAARGAAHRDKSHPDVAAAAAVQPDPTAAAASDETVAKELEAMCQMQHQLDQSLRQVSMMVSRLHTSLAQPPPS